MGSARAHSSFRPVDAFDSLPLAPSSHPSRLWPGALLVTALYSAATLIYLRPIWEVFGTSIAPDTADPLFSVTILKWVVHQIRLGFPNLWDAPFFYPARSTLALSDHMLGPAFEIAWIKNPIAGYNLLIFSSFVLCGVGTWWVLRRSGSSGAAALLGGAAFAFSPFRWSHLNHLLMLVMQWIPLTLWSFDRLLAERTWRRGAVFLLFYGLELTAGCYFAYMIHFPMLAILGSRAAAVGWRRLVGAESLRVLAPVAAVAATAAVAIFFPYLRLSQQLDMTHEDRLIGRRGGAALASYVSPAPANLYSLHSPRAVWDRGDLPAWQRPFVRTENSLFPGFLPAMLALYGLWEVWRRYRARAPALPGSSPIESTARAPHRWLLWGLAVMAFAALVLGDLVTLGFVAGLPPFDDWSLETAWTVLGLVVLLCLGLLATLRRRWTGTPLLRWSEMDPWHRGLLLAGLVSFALSFPVIYFPLLHVVPGLRSMRAPARFDAFVSLTVACLAAWGLDRLAERGSMPPWKGLLRGGPRRASMAAVAVAWLALWTVLAVELAPRPVRWVPVLAEDEFPDVYGWIRSCPGIRALVELPLRQNWREVTYMYYSSLHWKPIANGYSGFVPPSYDELAAKIGLLPDSDGFEALARSGISHLVVHSDLLVRHAAGEGEAEARGTAMVRDWERRFLGRRIELLYPGDPDRVYRLLPVSTGTPPPGQPLAPRAPGAGGG